MHEPGNAEPGNAEPGTIRAGTDESGRAVSTTTVPGEIPAEDRPDEDAARRSVWNRRVALIGGLAVLIAAAVVLPPLVNVERYQHRVTALMARSLGRPVHMSGVELRLLPRPGFVLHDLSVSEDPNFGAEPVLSAQTVVASIRILSLWRGRLEIDRVSVDEASLNLVRTATGKWNLDSLVMGAQPVLTGQSQSPGEAVPRAYAHFPYLEATNSWVHLKFGVEKSPYSLQDTDLSLWQDAPGQWRFRLRGQPVRTDIPMSLADTGELRAEGNLHAARQLREMPLQLQVEWRDAQLGQLSRLLLGSDAGWRGDVTADIEVKGTPDSAQTKARLRVIGVRREEFIPETPLDFDANCNLRYQHSQNAIHDLGCDTAIGDGRLHLKGELPGNGGQPEGMLEVSQVPVQAGLDLLRTIRGGFAPGISAKGVVNGSLTYKPPDPVAPEAKKPLRRASAPRHASKVDEAAALPANLHGALTMDGVQLKGGELKEPLLLPKITWTPALLAASVPSSSPNSVPAAAAGSNSSVGLSTRFTLVLAPGTPPATPAAGQSGTVTGTGAGAGTGAQPAATPAQSAIVRLEWNARGYDAAVNGSAGVGKLRDLAYAFGLPHLDAADGLGAGNADFDFAASGPWIASEDSVTPDQADQTALTSPAPVSGIATAKDGGAAAQVSSAAVANQNTFSGSLQLRHAQWKAAYLARPVDLTQAALTVSAARIAFASDFSYGGAKAAGKEGQKDAAKTDSGNAVHGSVTVNAQTDCKQGAASDQSLEPKANSCAPQVALRFGALDAGALQTALVGAPEEKSIFAPLMARVSPAERPKWPEATVTVQADSLTLGPATLLKPTVLQKPIVRMRFNAGEVVIEDWTAGLLNGSANGTGHIAWAAGKPEYTFDGNFSKIDGTALGTLLNTAWDGGSLSGKGSMKLSGLAAKELAASATGELTFDWPHGAIAATAQLQERFDDWNGTVAIQNGKAQIGPNVLLAGKRRSSVAGAIPFGGPVKITVTPTDAKLAAKPATNAAQPASPPNVK